MPRKKVGAAGAAATEEHNADEPLGNGGGRGRGRGRRRGRGGRGQSSFHRSSGQEPLEQRVEALAADISAMESRVHEALCRVIDQKIQQTQAELVATHQRELAGLVEAALRTQIGAINEAQHRFELQLRDLQAQMQTITSDYWSISRRVGHAEGEIRSMDARIRRLRDDYNTLQKETQLQFSAVNVKAEQALKQSTEMDRYVAAIVHPALNILVTQPTQLQAQITFLMQTVRMLVDFAHRTYREMAQVRDATSMTRQADTFQPTPAFFAGPIPAPVVPLPLLQPPPSSARAAVAQAQQARAAQQGTAAAAAGGPGVSRFSPMRGLGHR